MAQFEIFDDKSGQFRWRFQANNHEIVADSEAYTSKASCQNGIDVIKREAANATVLDRTKRNQGR